MEVHNTWKLVLQLFSGRSSRYASSFPAIYVDSE